MPKLVQDFNVRGSGGKVADYLPEQNAQRILQISTGGSGEVNTASNQGTDGIGVFDAKVSLDLQFRHIAPASAKITVSLNGKDIDLDVATGTTSDTVCIGDDARLSDARTPLSHALNSHTQSSNVIFMTKGASFTEIGLGSAGYSLVSGGEDEDLIWEDHYTKTEVNGLLHTQQHAITTTADHTSTATPGQVLKADANGLPVDASNTDTDVASAVSLKHSIYTLEQHNNDYHSDNYHTESDGTGVVTVHSDMTSAGSGSIITTGERGDLHEIYTLEQHNNDFHSTNYEPEFSSNNWKMYATNGSAVMTELSVGTSGQFLIGNGATSAPSFQNQPAPISHNNSYHSETYVTALGAITAVQGEATLTLGAQVSIDSSGWLEAGSTPAGTTALEYNGYFYATRVYNAVYNDYADFWRAEHGVPLKPGYCYSFNNKGLILTNKRNHKACMGICSDTFGFATGQELNGIPISVAGFLLAYVDKVYKAGTLLIPNKESILTKARFYEKRRPIAKYMFKETKLKTRNVKVNNRSWIKIL